MANSQSETVLPTQLGAAAKIASERGYSQVRVFVQDESPRTTKLYERTSDQLSLDEAEGGVSKTRVFETALFLNSRLNPNTSASKMAPGRYDPVYEEGSQDYPLPYIPAGMLPKPQHGGIPQVAGR